MYGETLFPYPDNVSHTQVSQLVKDKTFVIIVGTFVAVWLDTSDIPRKYMKRFLHYRLGIGIKHLTKDWCLAKLQLKLEVVVEKRQKQSVWPCSS